MNKPRHFLTLLDLTAAELKQLVARALDLKQMRQQGLEHASFKNKTLIMLFEKSSTRTRLSFEIAMHQLGGHAIFLSSHDSQLGRGEPVEDSARVLSRLADIIMFRTSKHSRLLALAHHSSIPVINGLTDDAHPCQLLADMMTYQELRGGIQGKKVAWIGDGNNMCHSYMNAAKQFSFNLHIACPQGFEPKDSPDSARITLCNNPAAASINADLVVTDVWTSMGQEEEKQRRLDAFSTFQVDAKCMSKAKSDALFLHCLPAHRGEEVSAEVFASKQSAVFIAAENRMHSQKALLELLMSV